MQNSEDSSGDSGEKTSGEKGEDNGAEGQFPLHQGPESKLHGSGKLKTVTLNPLFRTLTNEQRRRRLLLVSECVEFGMTVAQMANFLPTWGLSLSRSALYKCLKKIKLPKWYWSSDRRFQSHHHYETIRFFIRLAQDAAAAGFKTSKLARDTTPCDGARFRPDFKFEIGPYRFYLEMQLTGLTETRWAVKFRNYARLRQLLGKPFRALFVIDQVGDLAGARSHALRALVDEPEHCRDLLLFLVLGDAEGPANLATDRVWMNALGEKQALLQWLSQPGQKPVIPR